MKIISLLGIAGSGKGTQCEKLRVSGEQYYVICPGDLLRDKIRKKEISAENMKLVQAGKLLPFNVVNKIIFDEIERAISLKIYSAIALDGYPRCINQSNALDNYLSGNGNKLEKVILLSLDSDSAQDRLKKRFYCKQCHKIYSTVSSEKAGFKCVQCGCQEFYTREDDSESSAIKKRFKVFAKETADVVAKYENEGILVEIDANDTPEEIYEEIIDNL